VAIGGSVHTLQRMLPGNSFCREQELQGRRTVGIVLRFVSFIIQLLLSAQALLYFSTLSAYLLMQLTSCHRQALSIPSMPTVFRCNSSLELKCNCVL
jgi:hypothetical protein